MREIVLDTETTGLDPAEGHRLVEIGCVELENHIVTGRTFQEYINPERTMPESAYRVHRLSTVFLAKKPKFAMIVQSFLEFIGEANLIIHNAGFDIGFLNAELTRLGMPEIPLTRAVDTVTLARKRFPGAQASLDALCRRFSVNTGTRRNNHGALLDAQILSQVYLELIGGRQPDLALRTGPSVEVANAKAEVLENRPARSHTVKPEEKRAHTKMLERLKDPIWRH